MNNTHVPPLKAVPKPDPFKIPVIKYPNNYFQLHKVTLPKVYSEPSNFGPKSRYCKVCDMKFKLKSALSGYLQKIHHIANYLIHPSSYHIDKTPELYQGIDFFYTIHLDKIHGIGQPKPLKLLPSADDPDINNPKQYYTSCDRAYLSKTNYRHHLNEVHNLVLPVNDPRRIKAEYKSMKYYRSHMRRYHHLVARSTESLSQHVNRNVVPVIDQVDLLLLMEKTNSISIFFPMVKLLQQLNH
ncbi:hypothetical protein EDC94DRAFT_647745 [Helicostylum pulchrum]|nr:hypothetical protein EDC94DRAFT_647745 [Helicostylum pulchrum]